jgi:hypothetical protein
VKWEAVRQIHSAAAKSLAATAERIPSEKWTAPRAEGKWSPAEIVEHLNMAYDVLSGELAGGPGMQIRTSLWQQLLLRFTMVPKILRGGGFPEGARAPREFRNPAGNPDQRAAISGFRDRAARFEALAAGAEQSGRRVRISHAYFGRANVRHAVLLCARHVEHHGAQLSECGSEAAALRSYEPS